MLGTEAGSSGSACHNLLLALRAVDKEEQRAERSKASYKPASCKQSAASGQEQAAIQLPRLIIFFQSAKHQTLEQRYSGS